MIVTSFPPRIVVIDESSFETATTWVDRVAGALNTNGIQIAKTWDQHNAPTNPSAATAILLVHAQHADITAYRTLLEQVKIADKIIVVYPTADDLSAFQRNYQDDGILAYIVWSDGLGKFRREVATALICIEYDRQGLSFDTDTITWVLDSLELPCPHIA